MAATATSTSSTQTNGVERASLYNMESALERTSATPDLGTIALVLEEWLECAAYGALLAAQWHLFTLVRLHARPSGHGNAA